MKFSEFLVETPRNIINKFFKDKYSFMTDTFEWENYNTMKVLVPADADYLLKILKKLPLKQVEPVYDEKTKKITFKKK